MTPALDAASDSGSVLVESNAIPGDEGASIRQFPGHDEFDQRVLRQSVQIENGSDLRGRESQPEICRAVSLARGRQARS